MCDPVPDQHLLLPGQQDSGPQATFPYYYLQHREEASNSKFSTTCSISRNDLNKADDTTTTINKKIFIKTRNQPRFGFSSWNEDNHSSSTATPILSSMLASEPTGQNTG